jgi:hypothetical protein
MRLALAFQSIDGLHDIERKGLQPRLSTAERHSINLVATSVWHGAMCASLQSDSSFRALNLFRTRCDPRFMAPKRWSGSTPVIRRSRQCGYEGERDEALGEDGACGPGVDAETSRRLQAVNPRGRGHTDLGGCDSGTYLQSTVPEREGMRVEGCEWRRWSNGLQNADNN